MFHPTATVSAGINMEPSPAECTGPRARLNDWCVELPKCELHAHLSGSVPKETLLEFLEEEPDVHWRTRAETLLNRHNGRSLDDCFALFPIIQHLINTPERLARVVREVLCFYERDNTIYLELRTTPRPFGTSLTAWDYARTVLRAVADFQDRLPTPTLACRVLLSVSRAEPLAHAHNVVAIAHRLNALPASDRVHGLLVGVELSGNPQRGVWADFAPILQGVRRVASNDGDMVRTLRVSLHFCEVRDDAEAMAMLNFIPDRVGHACCMGDVTRRRLQELRIPVEACLTSNLRTKSVSAVSSHPVLTELLRAGHPVTLNCDDCGIFATSLSREFQLAAECVKLGKIELLQLVINSIDAAFCADELKAFLRQTIDRWARQN